MSAEVIREFLVSIGYRMDAASERRVTAALGRSEERLRRADRTATEARDKIERDTAALGTAIGRTFATLASGVLVAAGAIATASIRIAAGMSEMHNTAQRTQSSVRGLQAFGYAAKQLGSSSEEAIGFVEILAKRIRTSPGYEEMLRKSFGINTRDANGSLKEGVELAKEMETAFRRWPTARGEAYADVFGLPDKLLHAFRTGQITPKMEEALADAWKLGLDPDKAAKSADEFIKVWDRFANRLSMVGQRVAAEFAEKNVGRLERFSDYILENGDEIATKLLRFAEAVDRFVNNVVELGKAFANANPQTRDMILALGALALALVAGPTGKLALLATGIVLFLPELKRLWEAFDRWAQQLTGQNGLTVLLAGLATVLTLKVAAAVLGVTGTIVGLTTAIGALVTAMPPGLLRFLGGAAAVGGLAAYANSQGILTPPSQREGSSGINRALNAIEPGLGSGGHPDRRTAWERVMPKFLGGKNDPDPRSAWERVAPKWLGGKDTPEHLKPGAPPIRSGRAGVDRAASPNEGVVDGPLTPGKYRPVRELKPGDLSDRLTDIVASEARMKDPRSVDAVINNMFNRLGSKGWGPSATLEQVADAPGQYEGAWKGRNATAAERELIRERVRAIATGGVPDITNGANTFRAEWYGAGGGSPWFNKIGRHGTVHGGNRFAFDPSIPNGPYAPYKEPKNGGLIGSAQSAEGPPRMPLEAPARWLENAERGLSKLGEKLPAFLGDGGARANPFQAAPLGGWGAATSSSTSSTTINASPTTNVTISGVGDAREASEVLGQHQGRVHADLLRNLQASVV